MYFIKTPWYLKTVYPSLVWDMPGNKCLYLTFDDGPVPGVTDVILDMLQTCGAKATFFCIGDNIRKHPALFDRIVREGHAVGNHTFHHVNGWRTGLEAYVHEAALCDPWISSGLFRPPYGRIGFQQIQELKKKYNIVMWDVLSGDFDTHLTAEDCIRNVVNHATDGSIIVFHDSEKAAARVLPALGPVLQHYMEKGFAFQALPYQTHLPPKGLHAA